MLAAVGQSADDGACWIDVNAATTPLEQEARTDEPSAVTLFTGQWADLPFEEVCRLASGWGYDGLEIACWGDHFEVDAAPTRRRLRRRAGSRSSTDYGLKVCAISNHLIGQAVCDHPIDERHQGILPPRVWGDGDPEGVRQRAAEEMKDTARAAARLGVKHGRRLHRLVDLAHGRDVPAGARRR